jgi:PhzF family phenazine biosynthesis protein
MKTFIVDAFTNRAFKGNAAGVCFPQQPLSETTMLLIAQEFGLSETAFVQQTQKQGTYRIRYFSPKKEIPLCGHATLASAKVIFADNDLEEIHFITVENIDLPVKRNGLDISMELPVYHTIAAAVSPAMLSALGLVEIINTVYSPNNKIIMLEIASAELLKNLMPDFNALVNSHAGINGVLVTALGSDEYDFHYRYFWPWAGTNEDPVTGGVQTFLANYWSGILAKTKMKAFQSSERTGQMQVELKDGKVLITGSAVVILTGELNEFI